MFFGNVFVAHLSGKRHRLGENGFQFSVEGDVHAPRFGTREFPKDFGSRLRKRDGVGGGVFQEFRNDAFGSGEHDREQMCRNESGIFRRIREGFGLRKALGGTVGKFFEVHTRRDKEVSASSMGEFPKGF